MGRVPDRISKALIPPRASAWCASTVPQALPSACISDSNATEAANLKDQDSQPSGLISGESYLRLDFHLARVRIGVQGGALRTVAS
jgi:hypothetical protein